MFAFTDDTIIAIFTFCGVIIVSFAGIFTMMWKTMRTTTQLNKSVNERAPGEPSILEMVVDLYESRGQMRAVLKQLQKWQKEQENVHKQCQEGQQRIERLIQEHFCK